MPLLTSPIDGAPMKQIHRYGIEIDICTASGGIWLDKGELEKLMNFLQQEAATEQHYAEQAYQPQPAYHKGKEYKRYKEKGYYGSGKHYKKKSTMSQVLDLFDF